MSLRLLSSSPYCHAFSFPMVDFFSPQSFILVLEIILLALNS